MARNMNMLGERVYIPNGRHEEDESRSPQLIGFGANSDTGRMTRYFNNGSELTTYADPDSQLRAGFDDIMANVYLQRADHTRRGRATLGSMVGKAMDNGGMVPRELGPAYGQELGQKGPVLGTLTNDGTFMSLGIGQDGNIQPTGLVKPFDVMKSMVQSGDWKDAKKYAKKYFDGKYTPRQVLDATGYSTQWANDAQTKEERAQVMKLAMGVAQEVLKGGSKEPERDIRTRMLMDDKIRADIMRGKPIIDEKTGLQKTDDAGNLMYEQATAEEAKNKLDSLVGLARGDVRDGMGQSEMEGKLQLVNALLDRLYLKQEGSREADAIRQRALSRANVIDAAAGKTQLIRYVDKNGRQGYTRGYIVDGKAYNSDGDEMQGITPLDEDWTTPVQGAYSGVEVKPAGAAGGATVNARGADVEIAARKANGTWGLRNNGTPETSAMDSAQSKTTTTLRSPESNAQDTTSLNSPSHDDSRGVNHLVGLMNNNNNPLKGNAEKTTQPKPVKKSEQLEKIIATKKPAELWSEEAIMRLKRNHPNITDDDIVSGKYDRNLKKISQALYGKDYVSHADTYRQAIRNAKAEEDSKSYSEKAKQEQKSAREAIANKARALFGDLWQQADDYAIEHHGEDDLLFKDDYETERAKKFAELVKDKVKKDKIQLYNIYRLKDNVFGSYDVKSVFDAVFGDGAGTYIGSARPKSGATNIFSL